MKKLAFILGSAFLVACGSGENKTTESAGDEQNTQATASEEYVIEPAAVEKHLAFLASDEMQGRNTGSEQIAKAADYIADQFKSVGIKPYFETYRDDFDAKGTPAFNVVGVLPGNDPELKDEYVIIGAHYDHIGTAKEVDGDTIANGANDNASGTTTVIELAKHFAAAKTNKRSIIFALFSAEEKGLLGSEHLAEKLKAENLDLYVMFNIEMVGVPMLDKEYLMYITGYEMSNLADVFNGYCGKDVIGFLPQAKEFNLFNRSDNAPFYAQFDVAAQTVSTFDFTNFDHYHGADDEADKMDPVHMANVANSLIPGLDGLANSQEKTVMINAQ